MRQLLPDDEAAIARRQREREELAALRRENHLLQTAVDRSDAEIILENNQLRRQLAEAQQERDAALAALKLLMEYSARVAALSAAQQHTRKEQTS